MRIASLPPSRRSAACLGQRAAAIAAVLVLAACATVTPPAPRVESAQPVAQQRQAQDAAAIPAAKQLKRKIAIGRISNETNYGRAFLVNGATDPLGKQVADMLAARLVESGAFLVFERPDLGAIQREQAITGQSALVGVDALVIGSLTEFGRNATGEVGFLSATKRQLARAKIEIRLADTRTAQLFFSATGTGEATAEAGEISGFGSRAGYDATLNDKAIGAAVSDVMNALVAKLADRPWRTDLLKVQGRTVYISGGSRQGLKQGDVLSVMRAGETVRSAQSGFGIELPASEVATIRVREFFGDSDANEGSVAEIIGGTLPTKTDGLFVAEQGRAVQ